MVNSSMLQSNMTQMSIMPSHQVDTTMLILILLTILGFSFFAYFISIIFNAFFKSPHLWDSARYVLFIYMLMNDTFFICIGFYMWLTTHYKLQVPVPLCYVLYTLSTISYGVTPYNLGAMALEQYVAICHPLRHVELCTTYRAHVTFILICSMLTIPNAVELIVISSTVTNIFSLYIICWQHILLVNPIQNFLRSINLILCFSSVGITILVTYVKISLVAHRLSSQSSSASKAGKTVMFHAFQLLLCMASIFSSFIEALPIKQSEELILTNFLVFTCVPRLLSPVIYGIRDETLREHIKRSLPHLFRNLFGKKSTRVSR